MVRKLIVLILWAVFPLLAAAQSEEGRTALPERFAVLKLQEGVHDFGTTPRDSVLTYEFEFENSGNAPLWIIDLATSCPCTTAEAPRDTIPPGGKGKITVTYRENRETIGRFNQYVTIASNALREITRVVIRGVKEE